MASIGQPKIISKDLKHDNDGHNIIQNIRQLWNHVSNLFSDVSKLQSKLDGLTKTVSVLKSTVASISTGSSSAVDLTQYELEWGFITSSLSYYKEFTYNADGDISTITIYEDSSKLVTFLTKDIVYSSGLIDTITITRDSDGATLVKTFSYDSNNNIENIDLVSSV